MLLNAIDVKGQLHGRPLAVQSAYLWSRLALTGYILRVLGDGTEMASSVEGRTPFLDHHLFQLVRKVPVSLKVKDGREKHLLRQVMRPLLPQWLLRNGYPTHLYFHLLPEDSEQCYAAA